MNHTFDLDGNYTEALDEVRDILAHFAAPRYVTREERERDRLKRLCFPKNEGDGFRPYTLTSEEAEAVYFVLNSTDVIARHASNQDVKIFELEGKIMILEASLKAAHGNSVSNAIAYLDEQNPKR